MRTIAKWYPNSDEITYKEPDLDEALQKNPNRILFPDINNSLRLRCTKPFLTQKGVETLSKIKEELSKYFKISSDVIKHEYDLHCGCSCSCSPGFRLKAPVLEREIFLASCQVKDETGRDFFHNSGDKDRHWNRLAKIYW